MKQIMPGLWEIDEIGDRVHAYLWEGKDGFTLVDTGMPTDVHTIIDALTDNGYALHNVRRIIVTHGDSDHMGGAAKLKKATGPASPVTPWTRCSWSIPTGASRLLVAAAHVRGDCGCCRPSRSSPSCPTSCTWTAT